MSLETPYKRVRISVYDTATDDADGNDIGNVYTLYMESDAPPSVVLNPNSPPSTSKDLRLKTIELGDVPSHVADIFALYTGDEELEDLKTTGTDDPPRLEHEEGYARVHLDESDSDADGDELSVYAVSLTRDYAWPADGRTREEFPQEAWRRIEKHIPESAEVL